MPTNPIAHLASLARKPERIILGLMSGTSLDGVDLALTRITGSGHESQVELEQFTTLSYPQALKEQIQEQMQPEHSRVDRICGLHIDLGQFLGKSIVNTLQAWGRQADTVDCVASHGQTLFHLPAGTNWDGKPFQATLQIGDGDQIAVQTGILTVSDFRTKDIAVGGDGAPLIPYVNFLMFSEPGKRKAFHNLGGISNLTYLPESCNPEEVLAFDTGPANVLINLAVEQLIHSEWRYDPEGQVAAKGQIHASLLEKLLEEPYFSEPPPKSTGRELFGAAYFHNVLNMAQELRLSNEDVIATLTALTAHSIHRAYHTFLPNDQPIDVYFSGGGVHNRTLMQQIQTLSPHLNIRNFAELNINPDAWEAIGFAVMANELLVGNTVTLPGVTGALQRTALGKISLP